MALQYGFNYHRGDKDDAKWKAKYEALGENEKDYYHNVLCWMLMMTDVGYVSKETIPVIAFRIRKVDGGEEFIPKSGGNRLETEQFREFLGQYIGYEANIITLSDREWAKKFLPKAWDKGASIKSDAQEETMRIQFEKEVLGNDRRAMLKEAD